MEATYKRYMKNKYEIRGDVTVIFVNTQNGIDEVLVSTNRLNELDEAIHARLTPRKSKNATYYDAWFYDKKGNRKKMGLHRFLMNVKDPKLQIDHINRCPWDNRDENLRIAKQLDNSQNITDRGKSGVRGVTYYKKLNKYRVLKHQGDIVTNS